MSATAKHEIGATVGVDLSDERWLRRARASRARASYAERVQEEIARLARRISWLSRKAARLPLNSNGRKQAIAEAAACRTLAALLPRALEGHAVPKLPLQQQPVGERAARLLSELAGIE